MRAFTIAQSDLPYVVGYSIVVVAYFIAYFFLYKNECDKEKPTTIGFLKYYFWNDNFSISFRLINIFNFIVALFHIFVIVCTAIYGWYIPNS